MNEKMRTWKGMEDLRPKENRTPCLSLSVESACLALPWGIGPMSRPSCDQKQHPTESCLNVFLRFRTCSLRGCGFSSVPTLVRTTSWWSTLISSQAFANEHDHDIWRFSTLLGQVSGFNEWEVASVPLCLGGLGLRSAAHTAPAAYWATWADSVGMFR